MNTDYIQVYVTGGTFDKQYNYINGQLYFKDTHLKEMFDIGRCTLDLDIKTLMMVDSLEMTKEDREIIVYNCRKAKSDRIIITHGTDTIAETARMLIAAKIFNKTIILMGAMIPFAFGDSSDGFFNLGSSLAFVQVLPPGVYICMNGKYFEGDNVKKNKSTGFFSVIK